MSEALTQGNGASPGPSHIRQFFKRGPGAVIFRSGFFRRLLLFKHFVSSYHRAAAQPDLFRDVKTYCMFVGHNKSGTSMIGAMLDAHPSAIVADEADALEYVSAGFSRDQIFHILLRQSRREFRKGRVTARRLQPYSYLVPGQWQGRYRNLQVIGDSTAGSTTRRFALEPDLLSRVRHVLYGVDVKIIQVVRNPYDPISAMMVRGGRSFENAIETYFSYCETLTQLRQGFDAGRLFTIRHEDFVRNGELKLKEICSFLGLPAEPDYIGACARVLHKTPDTHRHLVKWDASHIDRVAGEITRFDFLDGYSLEP